MASFTNGNISPRASPRGRLFDMKRKSMKGTRIFSNIFFGTFILILSAIILLSQSQQSWNRQMMVSTVLTFDSDQGELGSSKAPMTTRYTRIPNDNDDEGSTTVILPQVSDDPETERISEDEDSSTTILESQFSGDEMEEEKTVVGTTTTEVTPPASLEPPASAVSWLISFPNSGTTYTIHNTEHVSQRSSSTNYISEVHYAHYDRLKRIPVRPDEDNVLNGPWQRNSSLPMPPVTLTKTHCTGYDDTAPMQSSIISTERFLKGCREGVKYRRDNDLKNHAKTKTWYDHEGLVVSVIHLIRNPLDNIISRMHHGMKTHREEYGMTPEQAKNFMSSGVGVSKWCEVLDRKFWMSPRRVPKKITKHGKLKRKPWDLNILLKIPCHSELFRYVEWHNAAIRMIEEEQFKSMVVYYEDYETNFDETIDSVLDFLNLTRATDPLPFTGGKTYRDQFFSPQIQKATKEILQVIASKELWQILSKYYPSDEAEVQ